MCIMERDGLPRSREGVRKIGGRGYPKLAEKITAEAVLEKLKEPGFQGEGLGGDEGEKARETVE